MPQDTPSSHAAWPRLIQGGMGVYISGWLLARTVALLGFLGVISVTGIEQVWFSRLHNNNLEEIERMALRHFPNQDLVNEVREYCRTHEYCPKWGFPTLAILIKLAILSSYCEVWCAKSGHSGIVGINLMQKVQISTLSYLYGSLLARVDYVLVGAGIPSQFVSFLDTLTQHKVTTQRLVVGMKLIENYTITFNPTDYVDIASIGPLPRPRFLPIIMSHILAKRLLKLKKEDGSRGPDGFIVEGPTAGGHNAPPREEKYDPVTGEPIYGSGDVTDLEVMRGTGVPFYLAGGYSHPTDYLRAFSEGAAGVQIGTPLALCVESGMDPTYRRRLLNQIDSGNLVILANPTDSPTGFPIQRPELEWGVGKDVEFSQRPRICDIGLLLQPHLKQDGTLVWMCPAEPLEGPCGYLSKAIDRPTEDTDESHANYEAVLHEARKKASVSRCLCNGLLGLTCYGRKRKGYDEPPAVTLGKDLRAVIHFLNQGNFDYTAADVIRYITGSPA